MNNLPLATLRGAAPRPLSKEHANRKMFLNMFRIFNDHIRDQALNIVAEASKKPLKGEALDGLD